jgi:alpha-L-fucosidase 2
MSCLRNVILLEKPARRWDDGLPVGNGSLGAMVMGKVNDETIFINEETIWYGREKNKGNRDASENISKIRELLLKGDVEQAAFLAKMAMTSTPKYNNPYHPAGDLRLCFKGHNGKAVNYKRYLDIDNSIACVEYDMDNIHYTAYDLVYQIHFRPIGLTLGLEA